MRATTSGRGDGPLHLVDTTMYWSPGAGGVRRWIEAKRAWLADRPGVVHTIAVPGAPFGRPPCIPGLPLPFSGGYRIARGRRSAARALRALAPDAIELGDPWTLADAALELSDRDGVSVSLFCHADVVGSARRTLGAAVARCVARRLVALGGAMDRVRVPSRWMAERLLALGVPHVKLQPLGVDTAAFRPGRRDPAWRARLGLPPGARVALYAGRFAPEKRLTLLVDAIARLGDPWVLVAVGAGAALPDDPRVRTIATVRGSAALAAHLSQADLFVHAGDRETFGLAALEAMACGVPVVGSAAGGIGELVDDAVGCAVDGDGADRWAAAIAATAARDRETLGEAARGRALRFDWSHHLPAWLADEVALGAARRDGRMRAPAHGRPNGLRR